MYKLDVCLQVNEYCISQSLKTYCGICMPPNETVLGGRPEDVLNQKILPTPATSCGSIWVKSLHTLLSLTINQE